MLSNDVVPSEIGQLHFKLLGGPTVVTRFIEDGVYQWTHPRFGHIKMKRICTTAAAAAGGVRRAG
jgi:hypothetical protein